MFNVKIVRNSSLSYTKKMKQYNIKTLLHEGAVVVSGRKSITSDYQRVENQTACLLISTADWVDSQGGIVGHIKAYVQSGSQSCILSTTGYEVQRVNVTGNSNERTTITIVAIVFGIEKSDLRRKMLQSIDLL